MTACAGGAASNNPVGAYYLQGMTSYEAGNPEQALQDFERYLNLAPNAPDREEVIRMIEQLKSELAQ